MGNLFNINEYFKVTLIKSILIILFLLCILKMPYGYYQLVRFIGMISFGFFTFRNYEKNKIWFIIWLGSAILINPILKISFGRVIWNTLDVVWAIILIVSIFFNQNKTKT